MARVFLTWAWLHGEASAQCGTYVAAGVSVGAPARSGVSTPAFGVAKERAHAHYDVSCLGPGSTAGVSAVCHEYPWLGPG